AILGPRLVLGHVTARLRRLHRDPRPCLWGWRRHASRGHPYACQRFQGRQELAGRPLPLLLLYGEITDQWSHGRGLKGQIMHGFKYPLVGVQKVLSGPTTCHSGRTAPQRKIGHPWLAAEGGRRQVLQGGTDNVEQGAKDLRASLLKLLPKYFLVFALLLG